jgi:HK97 gp10 family phage protein
MDHDVISMDVPYDEIDSVIESIREIGSADMVLRVGKKALPRIGAETLALVRKYGPRSAAHKGPAKKGRYGGRPKDAAWRDPTLHAIDKIKVSAVKVGEDGKPYVLVGPSRGDNSSIFYLKFLEYGTKDMKAQPFLRPARSEIMRNRAVQITVEELNKLIKEEVSRK